MKETNVYYIKIETPRNMTMEKLKKQLIKQGHHVSLIGQRCGNKDAKNQETGEQNYGDIKEIVSDTVNYGSHSSIYFTYPHTYDLVENEEDFHELSIRVISSFDTSLINGLLLREYKEKLNGNTKGKIAVRGDGFDILLSVDDIEPWNEY